MESDKDVRYRTEGLKFIHAVNLYIVCSQFHSIQIIKTDKLKRKQGDTRARNSRRM